MIYRSLAYRLPLSMPFGGHFCISCISNYFDFFDSEKIFRPLPSECGSRSPDDDWDFSATQVVVRRPAPRLYWENNTVWGLSGEPSALDSDDLIHFSRWDRVSPVLWR